MLFFTGCFQQSFIFHTGNLVLCLICILTAQTEIDFLFRLQQKLMLNTRVFGLGFFFCKACLQPIQLKERYL